MYNMEHPPQPKVLFESEVPLEFKGDTLKLSFAIIDHGGYRSFDLCNKKSDIPSISLHGTFDDERSYITHIEILPDNEKYRGQGLGTLLIATLERELANQGVRQSFATFKKQRTLKFLLKNGYNFFESEEFTSEIMDESGCIPEDTLTGKEIIEKSSDLNDQILDTPRTLLVKELPRTEHTV